MDNRELRVIKKKNNKFGTQSITLQSLKGKKYEYPKSRILPVNALKSRQKRTEIVKIDRKSTRLNSSHSGESRMPSSA